MGCCTGAGDGIKPVQDNGEAGAVGTIKPLQDGGDGQVSGQQVSLHSDRVSRVNNNDNDRREFIWYLS